MRTAFLVTVVLTAVTAGRDSAHAKESKVKMKDLPPAVQKAVEEQSKGATLAGLAKEVENGATLYEAEIRAGNRTKDVTFDSGGHVVRREEETTLDSIPAPARDAIKKTVGKHKLVLVETVSEKDNTFYEAHYRSGLRTKELKVDAAGQPVK
ncbi:MAG: hypothetical protein ACRD8O_23090 [Bryobacteraceae bacterium]